MKKQILTLAALSISIFSNAQDISQSQVPSVILNQFKSQFLKATDVEWEMKGDLYVVDFEIGWSNDHEVWFNTDGKMVKHKEDISEKELPKAVKIRIKSDFNGRRIDDLVRISDNGKTVYKMELNALLKEDLEVVIDANGNVISNRID